MTIPRQKWITIIEALTLPAAQGLTRQAILWHIKQGNIITPTGRPGAFRDPASGDWRVHPGFVIRRRKSGPKPKKRKA